MVKIMYDTCLEHTESLKWRHLIVTIIAITNNVLIGMLNKQNLWENNFTMAFHCSFNICVVVEFSQLLLEKQASCESAHH